MLLAIDIGNTNIVFGVHDGEDWRSHWRIRTVHDKMPDEYGVLFRELLASGGVDRASIDTTVIASVVPQLSMRMQEMARGMTGGRTIVVGPGVKTGIKIRTDNPVEVGADIVCNAVAAWRRFGRACIIVDFGTALTFTALSGQGEIVGVAIAPGLNSAAMALSRNTAQLPQVPLVAPAKYVGKNTINSIQSGIIYGYTGLVEKLVDGMRAELGGEALVIATGGLSQTIAPLTDRFTMTEPWLILEGLRAIAELNP